MVGGIDGIDGELRLKIRKRKKEMKKVESRSRKKSFLCNWE